MNKRLMQFINDLAEEADMLEEKLNIQLHHVKSLHEVIHEQNITIRELKKKLRAKKTLAPDTDEI